VYGKERRKSAGRTKPHRSALRSKTRGLSTNGGHKVCWGLGRKGNVGQGGEKTRDGGEKRMLLSRLHRKLRDKGPLRDPRMEWKHSFSATTRKK